MILCYHKVDIEPKTYWWVSVDKFNQHMSALQGYEVVTLDDYDPKNPKHVVITFDGVYENVVKYALPIIKKYNYPFELFIIGDYIGKGNEFDVNEPYARFANIEQLKECANNGGRIQWHTKSHNINNIEINDLHNELIPPEFLKNIFSGIHFQWFAYPHAIKEDIYDKIISTHYKGALLCENGSSYDKFKYKRKEASENLNLYKNKVSVIIANYNYGQYIIDAVDSVLAQTIPADEIIIIDDASTDNSRDIINIYSDKAKIIFNKRNLGIIDNFRKAVELSTGDYIAFLGADNRMRCDYVEKCREALDKYDNAAIAYTDMLIFGERSGILHHELLKQNRHETKKVGSSKILNYDIYLWEFPDPTPDVLKRMEHTNFIHGSSMYRRDDYMNVGGYRKSETQEDHNLFLRMIKSGRKAIHIPYPLIEYRQHSYSQANNISIQQIQTATFFKELKNCQRVLFQSIEENKKLYSVIDKYEEVRKKLTKELDQKQNTILRLNNIIEKIQIKNNSNS